MMKALRALPLVVLLPAVALAQVPEGTFSADIYVDGDEAGTAVFTRRERGEVALDELRSEVSISLLGFEVFDFTQHVMQEWRDGEFHSLQGYTDDDGDIFETDLAREDGMLVGSLNEQPVELPGEAFPISVWHYEITRRPVLFDVKDLDLRHVEVKRTEEVLKIGGERLPTERFDFSAGWDATVWYDDRQRLVQFVYGEDGHEVKVIPERCAEVAEAGTADLPTC
ncbi:MAG TPA: DUF6134 family protein [Geminicoccaceae bacterium]